MRSEGKKKRRIFVIEDHPIFRRGLINTIEREGPLKVCGKADNYFEAVQGIRGEKPDLVIMDITLKDTSGLELVKKVKEEKSDLPVLILSMHNEESYALRALQAGASGYIMKEADPQKIIEAIYKVLAGSVYVSEKINQKLLSRLGGPKEEEENFPLEKLSNREMEIFALVAEGFTSRQIADKLYISIKTVYSHRARIKEKLNLESSSELYHQARLYKEDGLL